MTYPLAQKLAMLAQYDTARASGLTVEKAVKPLPVSRPTLLRWRAMVAADGVDALAKQGKRTGRPAAWEFTAEECDVLKGLRLKHDSLDTAARKFCELEAGRAETRNYLAEQLDLAAVRRGRHNWASCVRKAAHTSDDLKAAWRGEKALHKCAATVTRGNWWLDANGNQVPVQANDVWESDDMSINEPFRYCDPDGEYKIGRQILFTQDSYSRGFLGLDLIGRARDAYRVEDIADHILNCMDVWGMPLCWRIERGVWHNAALDGVSLYTARARKLGFIGEQWQGRKIGGLNELIHIEHEWTSNGKGGIEGSFDLLQSLSAHASTHIGRYRSEFETAAKYHRQAQTGNEVAAVKFWEMSEAAEALTGIMEEFGSLPKERAAFGTRRVVPQELYRERPPKREVPADQRWRFSPIKKLAVVRQGVVQFNDEKFYKKTWRFLVNGVSDSVYLDHGWRVVIAFHPLHPEAGCTVVNAEFGPANRYGYQIGEVLMVATHLEDVPQFSLRGGQDSQTANSTAAVRREHRSVRDAVAPAMPSTRQAAPAKSHLQDGQGRARTVSTIEVDGEETLNEECGTRNGRDGTDAINDRNVGPRVSHSSHRSVVPSDDDLAALEAEAAADFY